MALKPKNALVWFWEGLCVCVCELLFVCFFKHTFVSDSNSDTMDVNNPWVKYILKQKKKKNPKNTNTT